MSVCLVFSLSLSLSFGVSGFTKKSTMLDGVQSPDTCKGEWISHPLKHRIQQRMPQQGCNKQTERASKGSSDTSDPSKLVRLSQGVKMIKLHQEAPKMCHEGFNKDTEIILRRVATWANSGRKLVSSQNEKNKHHGIDVSDNQKIRMRTRITISQQAYNCAELAKTCPVTADTTSRERRTKSTGKVWSATVTSHRSHVRTEAEKGECEKLVAWVESCHERIQNESPAFQKLETQRKHKNFARVLSIQVVTDIDGVFTFISRAYRTRARNLVLISSKRSVLGARHSICFRSLPNFAVAVATS